MADEAVQVAESEETLLASLRRFERELLGELAANPAESMTLLVGGGAAIFYWAEREHNPGVRTYWDAVHYVATSLSVGYAQVFPVTPVGKIIGALVMMVGPSLSARLLDGFEGRADPQLLAKLDDVIAELRRPRA